VGHNSSKDLWVHSRNLEGILLPSGVECIDGVPQVMVLRVVPTRQCIGHYLSACRSRSGTSVPTDHLWPIEVLHCATKLQAPWSWDTLDLVLWGLGYAQLEQQTVKLSRNNRRLFAVGVKLRSCSNGLLL
jgi:hypothetical protein